MQKLTSRQTRNKSDFQRTAKGTFKLRISSSLLLKPQFNQFKWQQTAKDFRSVLVNEPMMALWHGGVCVLLAMVLLFDDGLAAPGTGVCTDLGTNLRCHQLCNMEVANTTASAIIVTGGVLDLRCPISSQVKVGAFYY
ncbi:MAG TPA: hypothetical protein V6D26_10275 [Stenomitos sp.]